MNKFRYPSLNGLRAISIIMVIISHLAMQNGIFNEASTISWLNPFLFFIGDGHLGVNIFFVISGFIITTLLIREESESSNISFKNFYLRRALRILPAYFFLLLVFFLFQLINLVEISNESWLTSLTFTKYLNWDKDWFTSHAWSLSVEENFYLIWPILFIAGSKVRKYASIFIIILVPIIRLYAHTHPAPILHSISITTRMDAIATGCFFAIYQVQLIEILKSQWNKVLYTSWILLFLLPHFPSRFSETICLFTFIPFGTSYGTFANFLIGFIILYSIFGPKNFWFKILNSGVLNYIGILSYSLYLWQQPFIYETKLWFNEFPQNIIFILAMAIFSYYIIEKPFLRLKSKFEK